MDPGDGEDSAPVKCPHGDRDEVPDRGEQDGAVQGFGRRVVRAAGRRRAKLEREPLGRLAPSEGVDSGTLGQCHLSHQVGAVTEPVQPEPARSAAATPSAAPGSR